MAWLEKRPWTAWLAVAVFPLLLNGPVLLNILKADPAIQYSGFAAHVTPGPLNIQPYFDGSVGIVIQPLGKLGAEDLVHGIMPWWDPYEGLGSALAGEMTPAVFYPLIFLQLLPNGQTLLTVAVEIFSGLFTLLLARRLGLGLFPGAVAAMLFSCNGTFAWLGSGWCYPLPLLPLLIYGVELCFGAVLRERVLGPVCIALAIAISISGCMIETAFLDALLGVAWALLRLAGSRGAMSYEAATRLVFGAVAGILIAAPMLIAFADDLKIGDVGMHDGRTPQPAFHPEVIGQMLDPYLYATTFYHDSGYAGVAIALLAICGLFGRFQRPLRLLLGGWVFLAMSGSLGLPLSTTVLLLIPGVKYTAYYRYLDGSWEFALALLVAFFLYDLTHATGRLRLPVRAGVASLIFPLALSCLYPSPAGGAVDVALKVPGAMTWFWISLAWAFVALALVWAIAALPALAAHRAYVVAGVALIEAAVAFSIPALGNPTQATMSLGAVDFLKTHLGLQRIDSLGPLIPSYGSYYDIAELDDIELPLPRNFENFEVAHLDSQALAGTGAHADELARNLRNYQEAAVKYVLMFRSDAEKFLIDPRLVGFKLAYSDDVSAIYEVPGASPYFTARGCTVISIERTSAVTQCASPSTLVRRELFMPGWTAVVNGASTPVSQVGDVYQSISLPAGPSSVTFSFEPPFMQYGYSMFAVAFFAIAYQYAVYLRSSGF